MKRSKAQPENTPPSPPCEAEGCAEAGEYPAPRFSRQHARDYHYFCLQHVRKFNKQYNFFTGMDEDAVQSFMKDAVTGHRPTWRMGRDHTLSAHNLEESIRRFFGDPSAPAETFQPLLPQALRRALGIFSLSHPTASKDIKKRYKQLVKIYHPDVNKNSDAAEKFKEIMESYQLLMDYYLTIR